VVHLNHRLDNGNNFLKCCTWLTKLIAGFKEYPEGIIGVDKNGVGIYEGDIISELINSKRIKSKVIFYHAAWMVEWNNDVKSKFRMIEDNKGLEIIGNIYENPELLEVESHEL